MKISIERTGGFAGIPVRNNVDSDSLTAEELHQLQEWLKTADFFNLPETIAEKQPQPDRFQYKITIDDNNRHQTITRSEGSLPATLHLLVNWLMEKSRQVK